MNNTNNMNNMNSMNTNAGIDINNNVLFGPYEGFVRGNLFRNLYNQYKSYQPRKLSPGNEREELLLNLNQMQFAMHELNLYLDLYPTDRVMLNTFNKFLISYNRLLDDYQNKYGPLFVTGNESVLRWAWDDEPAPWERRDS